MIGKYFLQFSALNGGNRIFHRACAERYRAQRLRPTANSILGQINRTGKALGRDVNLCAAVDELLYHLFQTNRDTARTVSFNNDLLIT